ncbi:winged helix-turn-helix domain-containing protein [Deinococcus aestuarii]|uniref:winged helix-turn-helix domain-containing protein n=1 Tax=Deinococcus aestuarii TaxID=2774531 RepID=UPI001C0D992D|nr:winged helix-turn-helix domain-containing protein [Deinococcus aestuarii]
MKPLQPDDEFRASRAFPDGSDLRTAEVNPPALSALSRAEDWNGALAVEDHSGPVQSSVFREWRSPLPPSDRQSQTWRLPVGFVLDLGTRELSRDGLRAALTRREFALLELLARHPGRTFTRAEIIAGVWVGKVGVQPRVIDVHVRAIRRKTVPPIIETSRCAGYRLGAVT